jgi:hypothetical protein
LSCVAELKILGCTIGAGGVTLRDLHVKTGRGVGKMNAMRKTWWTKLGMGERREIYNQVILSSVLYGSEVWEDSPTVRAELKRFELKALKMITGRYRDKAEEERESWMSRKELQQLLGVEPIESTWTEKRSSWVIRKFNGNCAPIKNALREHRSKCHNCDKAKSWWEAISA